MRSPSSRPAHGGLIRGALAAAVATAASLLALAAPAYADRADHSAAGGDDANRISQAQVPDGHGALSGAISVNVPAGKITSARDALVRPYLANLAVPRLVAAGPRYFPAAKAYLTWYLNHLQWPDRFGVYGTVCDYRINVVTGAERYVDRNGKISSTCYYGSSDGYAGTFLLAMKSYAQANPGDAAWIARSSYELEVIANSIEATRQSDGLTWATPNWHGKYLTNNVEAEQGLEALSWLERNVIGDTWKADYWAGEADIIASGIQAHLYVPGIGMYANDTDLAATCAGGGICPNWKTWRPAAQDDATATGRARPLWIQPDSATQYPPLRPRLDQR